MKIKPSFRKILRYSGGLFIGVKVHFPVSIWDGVSDGNYIASMTEYTSLQVSFGFIAWELHLDFRYNITPISDIEKPQTETTISAPNMANLVRLNNNGPEQKATETV